jgi:hypothetical protein
MLSGVGLAWAARHLGLALAARQIEVIRVWVLVGIDLNRKIARQLALIRNPEKLTLGVGSLQIFFF